MKRPLGISLVSTFSDRAGAGNVGHGLLFHYNHDYSLGITTHDGDIGVFLSVDLLKFLEDKASKVQAVKTRFSLE